MNRTQFIKLITTAFAGLNIMKLNALSNWLDKLPLTSRMPVLFLGHGSPMNAIEENEFVLGFRSIGKEIPKPNAILCISAHWETRGTQITAMAQPKTIHDFGGFPQELFNVQYSAPGSPELAKDIAHMALPNEIILDQHWGLDHGTWSVVKHLYPKADIPVLQLSLDQRKNPKEHYELAKQLLPLRDKGVLIIGSGNLIHNLRMVAWDRMSEPFAYDWNLEVISQMKNYIQNRDHFQLMSFTTNGPSWKLAIPTPEHYLPLLYCLGLQGTKESTEFYNEKPVAGSLDMTSIKIS